MIPENLQDIIDSLIAARWPFAIWRIPGETELRFIAQTTGQPQVLYDIKELNGQKGTFVVGKIWPGKSTSIAYKLGDNWYTDKQDPDLFEGAWQGSKTVSKWRNEVLSDWSIRWGWLK